MQELPKQSTEEKNDTENEDDESMYKTLVKQCHRGTVLESDSFNEAPSNKDTRRRKKLRKHRPIFMDVDPHPSTSRLIERVGMDHDGDNESHLSSSCGESDDDTQGREGDDEQSDWQEYSATDTDFDPAADRRPRRLNAKAQMSQLQRRLERFALDGTKGEMGIEFKIRDRPNSTHFNRLLMQYRLEVVNRQRGNVVLRKKVAEALAK